jgi:putative oligomerization/nucleic acid binding protein
MPRSRPPPPALLDVVCQADTLDPGWLDAHEQRALTSVPERGAEGRAAATHGQLRKLQELRDAGLLTQEEYEAKRTEVINSI